MNEIRYLKISPKEMNFGELERIYSLDVSDGVFCDFYSKLYTVLGKENSVNYEGFNYYIHDTKTGIKFSAELTAFGAGYFGKREDLKIILEFEKTRQSQKPVDCRLEYEHDYGKTILGAKDGVPFYEEILDDEE